jgi:hypothetical protein
MEMDCVQLLGSLVHVLVIIVNAFSQKYLARAE